MPWIKNVSQALLFCAAPSASEAYETRCSLNFGTRARTITNKERMLMNVEVDYKLLTKRLSKRIFQLETELNKKLDATDWMETSIELCNPHAQTQTDIIEENTTIEINPFSKNIKTFIRYLRDVRNVSRR